MPATSSRAERARGTARTPGWGCGATLFLTTAAQAGVYGGNPAPIARPAAQNTIVPVLKGVYGGNPTLHVAVAVSHPMPLHSR